MDVTKTHTIHDFTHGRPLISCRFDPSGRFIFVGAEDFRVWRWKIDDGTKTELPADAWVRGMAFADEGRTLITGGYDGRLIWWPVESEKPEPTQTIEAHQGWVRAVAVSPDGSTVASVGNDLIVRLWNAADGAPVREMAGHESHIYNVAFHPDGKHLVTGDLKCNVFDWELATGEKVRAWQAESLTKYDKTFLAFIGGFRGMTFSGDGKRLACCGITNVSNAFAGVGNPSVVEFDWEAGKPLVEHLSKDKIKGTAWGVALLSDGTAVAAVGGNGGFLLFWKPDGKEEFHQMKLPNTARDLDLSPDGLHLATAHHDGHLRIHKMDVKA